MLLALAISIALSTLEDEVIVNWGETVCAHINRKDFQKSYEMSDSMFGALKANEKLKKKYQKAEFYKAITCLEAATPNKELSARDQALLSMQIALTYGIITLHYSTVLGRKEPGRRSFYALREAHKLDPTFELAWVDYGEAVYIESKKNGLKRPVVESALDISLVKELTEVNAGLQKFSSEKAVDLSERIFVRLKELK